MFSHGAQHGIMLALLATGCVGETLFCEGLSYPGMLGNARQLKNQVMGLAMDEEGLIPAALEAACRQRRAKLLYLTPTLQNPTTATMSLARREEIVAIARRHNLLIVEDDVNGLLGYDKEAGRPAQRQLFVDWLAEQGITASEDRLLFSHGAQHGIMLALLATGCVGETLFCEGLSYPGMLGNARQLKNQVVGLAMDEEGLLPEALDAACRTRRAKLLYLTPTLQNPTTATMSLARRDAIVAIARRHDLLIIEDEVNGLLPEPHPQPLVNLAPERVIYLGSLAKIACGGLRVGFVLTPPALRSAFAQTMRLSSWMVSPLLIELACKMVSQRQIMPLIAQQREILKRRGELLRHLLPTARWQPGSMHAWLPLPEPWRSQQFAAAADALDVGVASGEHFAAGQFAAPQGVRLSLSQPATDARVGEGLARLAQLLQGTPPSNPLL